MVLTSPADDGNVVSNVQPRIGSVEERLEWFARYGVRECWLVDLESSRIEVIAFRAGALVSTMFRRHEAVRSSVLPELYLTPADVM